MSAESVAIPVRIPLLQRVLSRPGVRQLIKFCIVGLSSTVVDKATLYALLTWTEANAPQVPWWACASISFCFAVTNGFIWHRRWTFQAGEHGKARTQYAKFVVSNAIGLWLNLMFTKLFLVLFTGQLAHNENPDTRQVMIASLCAVPCVVIWNFSVAKFWTFKKPKHT